MERRDLRLVRSSNDWKQMKDKWCLRQSFTLEFIQLISSRKINRKTCGCSFLFSHHFMNTLSFLFQFVDDDDDEDLRASLRVDQARVKNPGGATDNIRKRQVKVEKSERKRDYKRKIWFSFAHQRWLYLLLAKLPVLSCLSLFLSLKRNERSILIIEEKQQPVFSWKKKVLATTKEEKET